MKRLFFFLAVFALASSACGPIVVTNDPWYRQPGYVYSYPDGSCWADDVFFDVCPWYVGPDPGYYYHYRDHYYRQPRHRWYHRHQPPPSGWRSTPPTRDHRPVRPPRVRDHRSPRPHR